VIDVVGFSCCACLVSLVVVLDVAVASRFVEVFFFGLAVHGWFSRCVLLDCSNVVFFVDIFGFLLHAPA